MHTDTTNLVLIVNLSNLDMTLFSFVENIPYESESQIYIMDAVDKSPNDR